MKEKSMFSHRPEETEVTVIGDKAYIRLVEEIEQSADEEGNPVWLGEVYETTAAATGNISNRVHMNRAKWLEKAKADEEAAIAAREEKRNQLTLSDLAEMVVDQEYRICLIEMGEVL